MKDQLKRIINYSLLIINSIIANGQLKWINVDSLYQPLPSSVHVYFTNEPIDTGAFKAYYIIADLKDKRLLFDADTTLNRRLTPTQFYQKNKQPLVVVNCTFFSFQTNQNLNTVIRNGKTVSFNPFTVDRRQKDSSIIKYIALRSAIGISKKRLIDIAWIWPDSSRKKPNSQQMPLKPRFYRQDFFSIEYSNYYDSIKKILAPEHFSSSSKWNMETAVGGGPVLLQDGKIFITNEEEMMFTGRAINDKHPRTAMGYTKDGKLIILVVQGRSESGGGATLIQEAQILKDLGCWEALNLDGGGSSCMLINGKETIKPSDKEGQRAVPAVFIIKNK